MSGFRFQIGREGPRGCWSRGERCVLWKVYIGEERRALARSVVDEIRSGGWGSTARNVPTFKQSKNWGGGLERLAWSCRGRESPCTTLHKLSLSSSRYSWLRLDSSCTLSVFLASTRYTVPALIPCFSCCVSLLKSLGAV